MSIALGLFVAFEMASSHANTSPSLSHLNLHTSPPEMLCSIPPAGGAGPGPSKTTSRHSYGDSQHRVATALSSGTSANNPNWLDSGFEVHYYKSKELEDITKNNLSEHETARHFLS